MLLLLNAGHILAQYADESNIFLQRFCDGKYSFLRARNSRTLERKSLNRSARDQFFEVLDSRASKACGWIQTPKLTLNTAHFGLEESMPEYEVLILEKDA